MKKALAIFLSVVSIVTLSACYNAGTPDSTAETTDTFTADSSTAPVSPPSPPPPIETPPIAYEIQFIGANGEKVLPFEEMMFYTDIVIYSDGSYSQLDGDGHLAFVSVSHYLPQVTDKIPNVTLDENAKIEITAREGIVFENIDCVDVYAKVGETFEQIAEDMPLADIAQKGNDEWKAQTVYLYFDVGFHGTDAFYEKSLRNGYFVKAVF